MIVLIDRNGPPEALVCPAFLCDTCKEPLYVKNALALWDAFKRNKIYTVHKGMCDRIFEAKHGHMSSQELGEFVEQLLHNLKNPFTEEPNAEYVAPAPSTWRLGTYDE